MWTSHFDNSEAEMNNDNDEPPEFVQIERCYLFFRLRTCCNRMNPGNLKKVKADGYIVYRKGKLAY